MGKTTETSRTRRTWFEKLMNWERAYKTKISYGHRAAIGRGPTPEASQEAAERRWKLGYSNIFGWALAFAVLIGVACYFASFY
jgi:hypothetical protein